MDLKICKELGAKHLGCLARWKVHPFDPAFYVLPYSTSSAIC